MLPLLLPLIPEKIDYAMQKLNYGMLMIMWILMIYLVVSYQHGLESLESLSSYSQPRVGYESQQDLASLESPSDNNPRVWILAARSHLSCEVRLLPHSPSVAERVSWR